MKQDTAVLLTKAVCYVLIGALLVAGEFLVHDSSNRSSANAKTFGQGLLSLHGVASANIAHFFDRKLLGERVCGTASASCPTFAKHVQVIVFVAPKEQVIRVHAAWDIAFVKNAFGVWDTAICEHPRNTVCKKSRFDFTVSPDASIARSRFSAGPKPTGLGLFYLIPKSIVDGQSEFAGVGNFRNIHATTIAQTDEI